MRPLPSPLAQLSSRYNIVVYSEPRLRSVNHPSAPTVPAPQPTHDPLISLTRRRQPGIPPFSTSPSFFLSSLLPSFPSLFIPADFGTGLTPCDKTGGDSKLFSRVNEPAFSISKSNHDRASTKIYRSRAGIEDTCTRSS